MPTPYTGYVSEENGRLAFEIYRTLRPIWEGYLADIKSNKDPTRPSPKCGMFLTARYWQSLVVTKIKEKPTAEDESKVARKVRKTRTSSITTATASMARLNVSSDPPTTPQREGRRPSRVVHGAPSVLPVQPTVGGIQNLATSDEIYVKTAALLLLQAVTLGIVAKFEDDPRLRGLGDLDWLAGGLALKMYQRSPNSGGREAAQPVELLEARVDGYLCKGSSGPPDETDRGGSRFNNRPLALLEATPFVRRAGSTSTRWQVSAEVACWVYGLDDAYEDIGQLRPSTSGRKRYAIY